MPMLGTPSALYQADITRICHLRGPPSPLSPNPRVSQTVPSFHLCLLLLHLGLQRLISLRQASNGTGSFSAIRGRCLLIPRLRRRLARGRRRGSWSVRLTAHALLHCRQLLLQRGDVSLTRVSGGTMYHIGERWTPSKHNFIITQTIKHNFLCLDYLRIGTEIFFLLSSQAACNGKRKNILKKMLF